MILNRDSIFWVNLGDKTFDHQDNLWTKYFDISVDTQEIPNNSIDYFIRTGKYK